MHVSRASSKHAASYEHIEPDAGRQRAAGCWSPSCPGKSNILAKATEFGSTWTARTRSPADPRRRQGAGERGLPVRGGRGVVRAADGGGARHAPQSTSSGRLPGDRREAPRATTADLRGDHQGRRSAGNDRAHRGGGERPGQRARRRAAQGAGALLSRAQGDARWSTTRSASSTPGQGTAARSAS